MNEIITDPAALSAMTQEELATQVALRKGYSVEYGTIVGDMLPFGCDLADYLTADRVLSLLDEIRDCGKCLHWVLEEREKVSFTGTFMRPKDAIKVSHLDFKVCIVLAWLEAFDKGLLK